MEETPLAPEPRNRDSVGMGVLVGVGLHLLAGPVVLLVAGLLNTELGLMAIVVCGVAQLVYMLPAMAWCAFRQRILLVKGMALVAAITFLLNAGCWGLLAVGGSIH